MACRWKYSVKGNRPWKSAIGRKVSVWIEPNYQRKYGAGEPDAVKSCQSGSVGAVGKVPETENSLVAYPIPVI